MSENTSSAQTSRKIRNRLFMRRWSKSNRDIARERSSKQYLAIKSDPLRVARRNATRRKWIESNKEKIRKQRREYEVSRRKSNVHERIAHNMRNRLWIALKRRKSHKRGSFEELIGCSIPELVSHIENSFSTGMSWEKLGEIHIDHIKPINSFDLSNIEQQKLAFNYTNLQPMWASDNIRKGSKYG